MVEIDVLQFLKKYGEPIQKNTIKFLEKEKPSKLKEMMLDYPLRGGKHLRSVLAVQSCKAFGGDPKKMRYIAVALELFQHWILIHDDIEDFSDERRGKPALHHIYGMPLANNVGDALHIKMWALLFGKENRKLIGDKLTFKVMEEIADMSLRCTRGQSMELEWVFEKKWDIDEDDYYKMVKGKTCGYTFITPFKLGGMIAGISDKKLAMFEDIGNDLGIAFQIEDDVLNLIGEKDKYGKEIAGDIYEGKRTLMLIHLMKHATKEEKKRIVAIMNKNRKEKTKDEVDYILSLMKKYGSIEYAIEKARFFAKRAKRNFKKKFSFMKDSEAKRFIDGLFDFVVNREM